MARARVADEVVAGVRGLVASHELPPAAVEQMVALLDLLVEDDRAPTTVRDPLRALDDHLADSLVALELPQVLEATSIADLGSERGFRAFRWPSPAPTAVWRWSRATREKWTSWTLPSTPPAPRTRTASGPAPRNGGTGLTASIW